MGADQVTAVAPPPPGFRLDPPPAGFVVDPPARRPAAKAPPRRGAVAKAGVAGASVNEGLADTLGAPVDLLNAGLGLVGLGSDRPIGGSQSLRDLMHAIGLGYASPELAPQTVGEQRLAAVARGVGQSVIPAGAAPALGGRLALQGSTALARSGGAVRQSLRTILEEAAKRPGVAVAGELAGGAAAGASGQVAREVFPGNPYADAAAQIVGGAVGGVAAGRAVERLGTRGAPRPALGVPEAPAGIPEPPAGFVADDAAGAAPAATGEPVAAPAAPRPLPTSRVVRGVAPGAPKAAPGVAPHRGYQAAPLPPIPADNFSGKLSAYAPRMWRETNLDALDEILPTSRTSADVPMGAGYRELYLSNTPDLALGQGRNRGVMVEFDADRLNGRIDTQKPGWDFAWGQGGGEFVTRNMRQGEVQRAVRSVTVAPDAVAGSKPMAERVRRTLTDLEASGWAKRPNDDGSVTYSRPDTVEREPGAPLTAVVRTSGRPAVQPGGQVPEGATARPVMRGAATSRDATGRPLGTERLDLSNLPPPPPGFVMDAGPVVGGMNALAADLRDGALAQAQGQAVQSVQPGDVTPIRAPRSARVTDARVGTLAEAERANPPTVEPLTAPNERDALPMRTLDGRPRRNPVDLVTFLRRAGGIREQGGELRAMGIDNKPRPFDFAKDEGFFGPLVKPEGMPLDEAAFAAWQAGYFPDAIERPTVADFLDAVRATHEGGPGRVFHPDDLPDVENYYAAQGERFAIDRAEREGAPLARVRGEPVSLSDLDARTPPPEVYAADLPPMPERAGNVRLDLLDSPANIDRALKAVASANDGFEASRRGVMRQEQTKALASELGLRPEDLMRRRQGQALNAEQLLAARQLLAKSGNELVALAKRAVGGSDEDLLRFDEAARRHAAIQGHVSGAVAEAGRTLSALRMTANSRDVSGPVIRGEVVRSIIDGKGGRDALEEAARQIVDAGGEPAKINRAAKALVSPTLKDKLFELYYSAMLSGPRTHVVNVVSNTLTAVAQIPETATAAAIGGVRTLPARVRGAQVDRVLGSEVGARFLGMMQGAQDGLAAAAKAFRTGEPSDFYAKVEADEFRAISGRKGELIRIPTRALMAEDEFFKSVARRMELAAIATRKAAGEGLKGAALRDRIADLTANPSADMIEQAREFGRYLTFQKKLGPLGQRAMALTRESGVAKWLFPFIRTPVNLMKFAAERSPLAPALKEWRAEVMAGGARRDTALARMAFGTAVAAMAWQWALDGTITGGGPKDPERRRLMQADGWQPYSIRLGGTYYSYERLDPIATLLRTAADLQEVKEAVPDATLDQMAAAMGVSVFRNLQDSLWLDTMSNLTAAFRDNRGEPGKMVGKFLVDESGKLVPAVVGQTAQAVDPVLRDPQTVIEKLKSRTPGLGSDVLPRRDVWGEPIRSQAVGPDVLSPMRASPMRNDPLTRDLLAMGVDLSRPTRKVGGVELTRVEYDRYQELAGKLARRYLLEDRAKVWPGMTPGERADAAKGAIRDARADAREALAAEFPDLAERLAR